MERRPWAIRVDRLLASMFSMCSVCEGRVHVIDLDSEISYSDNVMVADGKRIT